MPRRAARCGPARCTSSSTSSSRSRPAITPGPPSLAEEVALLERARAALSATPRQALDLTEAHAARFPDGKLGMERELIAVDALRRLGRLAEARARCEAMLTRARGSLYEERIRNLLDGMR